MKKILFIVFFVFSFQSHSEILGVKFDKDYYFQSVKQDLVEVNVSNVGKDLVFTEITLAPGYKTNGNDVHFDFEKKLTNYDIFPATVAIPAGQTRTIKLVRHASSADNLFITPGYEEYYRIRAIPKPADEALKTNPELWSMLSAQDKQSLQDTNGTSGTVSLSIGSGSVIIVQKNTSVDANRLSIDWDISQIEGGKVMIKNNGIQTLSLSQAKICNGKQWIPLNGGGIISRPGVDRMIKITPDELKSLGTFMSSNNLFITFTLQDGKTYEVKSSNQHAIPVE